METNSEERKEIEEFITKHERAHFLQSPEWAKVKLEWKHEEIILRNKDGKIIAYLSVLLRKVPILKRYIMYAPRGPICDIHDEKIIKDLTNEIRKIAKKYKAFIFRADPDILVDDDEFKRIIKEAGIKIKENIKSINDVIQPKYVFRLNLKDKTEEEILQSFHQKTRYNIRLAARKGVTVRVGTKEELPEFYKTMKETGSRDNFIIRSLEYYEKIYECLVEEHVRIMLAEYEGEVIAATMPILYGNKVWYLYGGSKNEKRNLMPNYLLQWEMIKWALENKCDVYDFRGISGFKDEHSDSYGVYKFKKGFNPDFTEFIGEIYIIFNPIVNNLFKGMSFIYRKYGLLKNKIK